MSDRSHWDRIYGTRRDEDLSWHEEEPSLSLELIREACALPCRVIDVGGGSSVLAQRLVTEDRAEVTVLDISETALEKARARAGHEASSIRWIAADVTVTEDIGTYDVWHDRAAFHFLTEPEERQAYATLASRTIPQGGLVIIATFGPGGPTSCSGLPVCRYDSASLAQELGGDFELHRSLATTHRTPGGVSQEFVHSVFMRR